MRAAAERGVRRHMETAVDPLRFPAHFPPTTRWQKFFLGVRWIGPNLSFFKSLKAQQAARSAELMNVWGGGLRQQVAARVASELQEALGWKSAVFLPEDSFRVVCHGPSFDWGNPFALELAMEDFENHYGTKVPVWFWSNSDEVTFGEVIDGLVRLISKTR